MSDLEKLIEAVKRGTFLMDVLPAKNERLAYNAFSGSLDAAKALHDAMLPGWDWSVKETVEGWLATVSKPINIRTQTEVSFDNGARSWLLAILCAHAARDEA